MDVSALVCKTLTHFSSIASERESFEGSFSELIEDQLSLIERNSPVPSP